jgi:hypothetical protein
MDAPVYKKLVDIDNHIENPFSTKEGQLPVSLTENFWARLSRYGRPWGGYTAFTTASNTPTAMIKTPNIGNVVYVSTVMASCTVDAFFYISFRQGFGGNSTDPSGMQTNCYFAKAGTPVIVKFDGDVIIGDSGDARVTVQTTNTGESGTLYASITGIEVAVNA